MKKLFATTTSSHRNMKSVNIFAIDENDYSEIVNVMNHGYFAVNDEVTVGGIKFKFSREFIDALFSIYITVDTGMEKINFVRIDCNIGDAKLINQYSIQFKVDKDKKMIHFWDDVDYIMENLIENFTYTYDKAYSYLPKTKQINDLTKLTLGKI